MCKQAIRRCLNSSCNGFTQTLPLIPCENRPNCELKRTRIPRRLRNAESYCPICRVMTKNQRLNLMNQLSRRRRAEAKAQGVNTNGAGSSAPVGVEQHAESSAMAESRGATGGGFVLYDPASISEETNLDWQNEGRTGLVSGSEEMMLDASANEEGRTTDSLPGLTYGAQEIDPDAVLAAFNNLPGFVASTPFLARVARQRLHYGDPADMMVAVEAPSSNVLSIPPQEHQQPATPSPAPTEMSDSSNAELNATPTYIYPSPPGTYNTGPYPIEHRRLPTAPHSSPAPANQTGTNIDALPRSPVPPQFPVDAPSSPQIPIDPVLLELDALVFNTVSPVENVQEAEQILRDMGIWPESPKRSN